MKRRHRDSQPAGPDPIRMALEAQRRALHDACAGCCSQDYPCRYHKGYITGVRTAFLEYLEAMGATN